jgi:thioesterase superfamily protein 4
MEDAITDRIPWVKRLVNDPKWTRAKTPSRVQKSSGEDSYFAETLATERTMRSYLTFRCTQEDDDDQAYKEVRCVVEVGDGLNGFAQTLHGGMAATLLDETCGVLLVLNSEKKIERAKTSDPVDHFMTACKSVSRRGVRSRTNATIDLNTTYKKPIPTPGPILCTAKVERQDGRKLFVRATIEDGSGTIYTIGEALFVRIKPRL